MPVSDYGSIFEDAGKEWNVDPSLLASVASQESSGRPRAVSPAGAIGLMQFMPGTAFDVGGKEFDPNNPKQAIYAAAKLLRQHLDAFNGSVPAALAAYNAGPKSAHWGNPETLAYVPGVAAKYPQMAAQRKASAQSASDDDALISAFLGSGQDQAPASAAPAPAAPSAAPQGQMSDDDLLKAFLGGGDAAPTALTAPAKATASPAVQTAMASARGVLSGDAGTAPLNALTGHGFAPGVVHGAQTLLGDPINRLVTAVDQRFPALASLDRATGLGATNTPDQRAAREQAYQQQYGNNPAASAGNIVGQTVILAASPLGLAGRAIEAGGGALIGGSLPARIAAQAASGAVQGAGAAAVTGADPRVGGVLGGVVGGAVPVAGAVGNALVGSVPQDVAQLAMRAKQLGVPVEGGQISTSPVIKFLDSVTKRMPFSGAEASREAQQGGFNRAIANTIGESANNLTPDVMSNARTRIGQVFDDVAAKTTIPADPQLYQGLAGIGGDARQVLGPDNAKPVLAQIKSIVDATGRGQGAIDGTTYQALTRVGAPLNRLSQSQDPNLSYYANQVRDVLDDALERHAPPDVQNQLTQARAQWRNLKTLEPLADKSPTGNIPPGQLLSQVAATGRKLGDRVGYGGGGDLADLGRIGQQFLREAPSSGTAERIATYGALTALPMAAMGNPLLAAKAVRAIGAGRLVQGALRSDAYTNMLLNNSLGMGQPNALLAGAGAISPLAASLALSNRQQ